MSDQDDPVASWVRILRGMSHDGQMDEARKLVGDVREGSPLLADQLEALLRVAMDGYDYRFQDARRNRDGLVGRIGHRGDTGPPGMKTRRMG